MPDSGREYREPDEIPTNVECPACGSNLYMIIFETEIPSEGHIMIQTYSCHKCLFRKSSVFPSEPGKHTRLSLKVKDKSALNTMLYRSQSAFVYIPELGAEISPGEKSTGYITTVEGILHRLQEYIDLMPYDDEDEFLRVKKALEKAEEGALPFTLIIDDETGKSSISSTDTVTEYE